MLIIGLTGGIASGKSTVSTLLTKLGAYIIDADKIAREIVVPHEPAYNDIVSEFSPAVLDADGNINRRLLGEIVFNNPQAKQRLDQITHPRIKERIQELLDQAPKSCNTVVLDVPLLIETGWVDMVDVVWLVYVNRTTQIARLVNRDNLTFNQANARIASQMSLDEKIEYADLVLDNNNGIEQLQAQVAAAWQSIKKTPGTYAE